MPLRTQVRFTTMIVLPAGEQILEATCGDKELWLVNATQHFAYVKPAKPGSQTNLNLLTSSGTVYSFVLTEVSGIGRRPPGRQGLCRAERRGRASRPRRAGRSSCPPSRSRTSAPRRNSRARTPSAPASRSRPARRPPGAPPATPRRAIDQAVAAYRATYPTQLSSPTSSRATARRSTCARSSTTRTCTYIQAGARELPALYELNESGASLVTFEYRNGTYVVPKVLDRGYLAIGKARFYFKRVR